MKRALITGIFGQDGSYLAELLFGLGYEVHGLVRETLSHHSVRLQANLAKKRITPVLHKCNLQDYCSVRSILKRLQPAECYHLAATHYSAEILAAEQMRMEQVMFEQNTISTQNLLLAIKEASRQTHFVLAGSCQMYDRCTRWPQDEKEPFCSGSLYGVSKIAASQLTDFFRTVHGLHASTAVLYNHESPRRQSHFVTRRIVQGLVKVRKQELSCLELGNLDSVKDWGYARDYAYGMWLMAQAVEPRTYILATGTGHTIGDFVRAAANAVDIPCWQDVVRVQAGLTRARDQVPLVGDFTTAKVLLGWKPSVTFCQLVELMAKHELQNTLD